MLQPVTAHRDRFFGIAGLAASVDPRIALSGQAELPWPPDAAPDLRVRKVKEIGAPADPVVVTPWLTAAPRDFTFRPAPGLAFRIRDGRDIAIAWGGAVPPPDIEAYLLGSAWGVLCHQRGLLPLHCSAIAFGGRAFAITGQPGAGKSTLAAALCRNGLDYVTDDMGVLDPARDFALDAMPKAMKLCADAAAHLGITCGKRVASRVDKFFVAAPVAATVGTLAALYVLDDAGADASAITELSGAERFVQLIASIYRVEWLSLLRQPEAVFAQAAALSRRLRIFRFARPRDFGRFDDGVAMLIAHMQEVRP